MASSLDDLSVKLQRLTVSESEVQKLGQDLGNGAYGRVYTVKYCGLICAAKEIHSILMEGAQTPDEKRRLKDNFMRECTHCSELSHPNIVRFMGIYFPTQQLLPVMIMELMDESLTAYMEKNRKVPLMRKGSIMLDVAEGLSYLHVWRPPIVHRDLSPNNILLKTGEGGGVTSKIADLGVAKAIKANKKVQSRLTKVPGTMDYMPPEAFEEDPVYNTSLDVFSYGGVMLFVVNQEWPTPTVQVRMDSSGTLIAFTEVQRRQKYLDKMTGGAEVLRPLIESCLSNNPAKRPIMAAVTEALKSIKESPPLVPALQTGCYELTWDKCADLPSPMYDISAVLHDKKVYIMAGMAPDNDTLYHVYCYNITTDQWEQLPLPDHYMGILQIIDGKLTAIGGIDNITNEITKKVSSYIHSKWTGHFPDLLRARCKPGVVSNSEYVIVAGGKRDDDTIIDDIEILNTTQPSQWMVTSIFLPRPMWGMFPIISNGDLCIIEYTSPRGQSPGDQSVQWMELPITPHHNTRTIPNSYPPVIMGGSFQGILTSDVAMLDDSCKNWKRVSSLSGPRKHVGIVPIDSDTILVFGGTTGGKGIAEAKAHSITTMEKGRATLIQRAAAIPTEDTQCSIQ
ncbi:uncharacterized protein [Dysidea avara]|uniref:uncharacterized protein isoform X2 n=1 Tax=Dysidea avara TaxID=196820 RepID=UPI00332E4792